MSSDTTMTTAAITAMTIQIAMKPAKSHWTKAPICVAVWSGRSTPRPYTPEPQARKEN